MLYSRHHYFVYQRLLSNMWRSMLTKLGSWTGFKLWWSNTVLSRASAHTHVSTHPQILAVLWFFEVLHVTTHHAKTLRSESDGRSSPLSSHSCDCSNAFWAPWHQAWKVHRQTCLRPHSQRSSPAAQNLGTASNNQMLRNLGNKATSWSTL